MRSRGPAPAVMIGLVVATWAAAVAFYALGHVSFGIFLAVVAAVSTSLWRVRSGRCLSQRSFLHGYHAGFHDAINGVCPYPDCAVLPLAEERANTIDG